MKKRVLLVAVVSVCLFLLTACGCEHDWNKAECLLPKVCALCGETEGEPLGHNWQEVSCTAPKNCTRCKVTEGEALPHTWVEATYQNPRTCSVCRTVEGQPLEADFEKYGLTINMFESKHYHEKTEDSASYSSRDPYWVTFRCEKNPEYTTTAKVDICDYRVFLSDDNHAAVEGYVWRAIDLEMEFTDENFHKYGVVLDNIRLEDYYDIEKFDQGSFDPAGTQWEYLPAPQGYTVNKDGEDYPIVVSMEDSKFGNKFKRYMDTENGKELVAEGIRFTASVYVCVPYHYDGFVFGFSTPATKGIPVYEVNDENLLLMRFDNEIDYWWNGGVKP